jgi:preprotein translocase subunit SecE
LTADKIKLTAAVLILAIGIGGFYYLADQAMWARVLTVLIGAGLAMLVASQSASGKAFWEFAQGARTELRKVVWPTRKETIQVTLIVIAMVIMVAVFLWVVDWGLLKIVKALTGQRS